MGKGPMTEPMYVCVFVPEFAAQALLRLRPALMQSPVVVVTGIPPLEQVCSANQKAFRVGITKGMTCAELESFTGLNVLRRAEAEELTARAALLEAAGAFTPRVEIQQCTPSSFVMVLDMAGSTLIFGAAEQFMNSMQQAFTKLNFFTQIAASANFFTAVCIAPSAGKSLVLVAAGREQEFLHTLPLSALNLTAQQSDVMALWGLHSLGELAALPEVELTVRLGQDGKRLRLMARGECPHLMVPEEAAFALEEFVAFDAPVELMESLLFVMGPMMDQLLARAQNRSFALASVTIQFGLDGGGEHERVIKPALPVIQREVLLKLLHLDLQAHPPPAGVVSLLACAEPGDRSKVQLGLFAPQLPEPTRLDVTLARIAAIVGEERVGRIRLLDSQRSNAFVMERFVVPALHTKNESSNRQAVALRRCRPAVDLSMQHQGQRPDAFFLHGKRYTVQEAYGPWRKSGDWWSSEVWSSEEWDIAAIAQPEDKLLCLITHDLLRHCWQLEALYD